MSLFIIIVALSTIMFLLFILGLYIYVLVDILKNEFTNYNKIIWLILIIFFPILGAILYLFLGNKQKIKES